MSSEQGDDRRFEQLGELRRENREFLSAQRLAFFERWRLHVDPVEADRQARVRYAVQYGQMGVRSGFILNGGAIIAVPAFAEFLGGGLWAKGTSWPFVMVCLFLFGLIASGCATAFAFFTMGFYSRQLAEARDRAARLVVHDFEVSLGGALKTTREALQEPTEKEKKLHKRGWRTELSAIVCASISLLTFISGALIAVYILSGTPVQKP